MIICTLFEILCKFTIISIKCQINYDIIYFPALLLRNRIEQSEVYTL